MYFNQSNDVTAWGIVDPVQAPLGAPATAPPARSAHAGRQRAQARGSRGLTGGLQVLSAGAGTVENAGSSCGVS